MPILQISFDLDQQLNHFNRDVASPSKLDTANRNHIVEFFVSQILEKYNLKCELFGSFLCKTALPYSDIDLNITTERDATKEQIIDLLIDIPDKFEDWKILSLIKDAKIPVLTITKDNYVVQLTCNTDGVVKSEFMLNFIEKCPNTRLIIQLIKHLLHENGLDSLASGGLNTYSITVMVIALFHQFTDLNDKSTKSKLLLRFLEFYTYLNWSQAFITARGVYHNQQQLEMFVEDPMEYGRNLVHGSWQLPRVQKAFQYALENLYTNGHYPGFLKISKNK